MRIDAANALDRLAVPFEKKFKKPLKGAYGYRSYEVQERIFLERYDHTPRRGNTYANGGIKRWKGQTWHKKPGVSVAAQPGYSNHGWGLAIDLNSGINGWPNFGTAEYKWMVANAPAYGFTNAEGKPINESWHWVYYPNLDKHKNDPKEPTVTYKRRATTKTKQKVTKVYKNVVVDDNKSDVSVVTNQTGIFDSRLKAKITGLPVGEQIQFRAIRVEKDKAGKWAIQYKYPSVEAIGTAGGTFVAFEQIGKVNSNQRIRWQVVGFSDAPIVLDSVDVATIVHKEA